MEYYIRESELNGRQKNTLSRLEYAMKQAEEQLRRTIEPPGRELNAEEKLKIQQITLDKMELDYARLTQEELNNEHFRLNVLVQHMLSAGSAIVENTDAFAEAIKYCPESIERWYRLSENKLAYVRIPTEVMTKIVTKSPEILRRLPEKVIIDNRSSFLEIKEINKTLLELPAMQKIMEADKDFAIKLKGKIIEQQAQEAEQLRR